MSKKRTATGYMSEADRMAEHQQSLSPSAQQRAEAQADEMIGGDGRGEDVTAPALHPPADAPQTAVVPPAPANGAKARKPKGPRTTQYDILGTNKWTGALEVLGTVGTKGRVQAWLDQCAGLVASNYSGVKIVRSKDVTAEIMESRQ